jgi:hypothetical protein
MAGYMTQVVEYLPKKHKPCVQNLPKIDKI